MEDKERKKDEITRQEGRQKIERRGRRGGERKKEEREQREKG